MKSCRTLMISVVAMTMLCAGPASSPADDFISQPVAGKRPWGVLQNSMTTMDLKLHAVRTDKAPVIDGKVDDACWQKAFTVSALGLEGFKGYSQRKHTIRFLYDDQALYIACTGGIDKWHDGLAGNRARGEAVWMDDCFEVFIDPGLSRKVYYQVIANALGSMMEAKGRAPVKLDWEVKTSHTDKDWTAEMRIPFASLGAEAPRKGDVWGINVFRNDKDRNEPSSISPVQQSAHDTSRFAPIEFGDTPQAYLDQFNYDKIVMGDNVFRFRVFGSGVDGAAIRGQFKTTDGKPLGDFSEVKVPAGGEVSFPFAIESKGQTRLDLEIVKDGKTLNKYAFMANLYEDHLLLLVPGGADFIKGRDTLNLRMDLHVKEDSVGAFKVELALKQGDKVLKQAKIGKLPGGYSSCDMNIGDLDVGVYTLAGRLIGPDGKQADLVNQPIRIIAGPFSDAKLTAPKSIPEGPAGAVPEQFTVWGSTGKDIQYRRCTQQQIDGWKKKGLSDEQIAKEIKNANEQFDCRGWSEVQDEKEKPATVFTQKEKQRGYVLFSRSYVDRVYHYTIPRESERISELGVFAAQGQYEPITFSIHALKDLKEVGAKVTSLVGPGGAILPKESMDVRIIRSYEEAFGRPWWNPEQKDPVTRIPRKKVTPQVLETRQSVPVAANESRQFWITLKVPDNCNGGIYQGNVELTIDGAKANVPLNVRVLPFPLVQLKKNAFMDDVPADDRDAYYDYGEHGFNVIEIRFGLPQKDQRAAEQCFYEWSKPKDPRDRDQNIKPPMADPAEVMTFNAPKLEKALAAAKAANLDVDKMYLKFWCWIVAGWDRSSNWYIYYPTSPALDKYYADNINQITAFCKSKGLTGLMVFPADEPGGHPDTFPIVAHYLEVIHKMCPDASAGMTIGGGLTMKIDEVGILGPNCDVLDTNYLNEDILKQLNKTVKEPWICNIGSMTDDPRRDRYGFGFFAWKVGVHGMGQYAYRAGGNLYDQVYQGWSYVWPAAEVQQGSKTAKPLPTIHWEVLRQGIIDQRYGATLTKLIEIANASNDSKAKAAAAKATETVKDVLSQFHLDYMNRTFPNGIWREFYIYSTDGDYFDTCRWRIAQEIMNLQSVLGDKAAIDPKEKVFPLTPQETMFN